MRRLTEMTAACGCAAKLSPAALEAALAGLARRTDANLLVGFDHADDAAVYRLAPDLALVQTVDFFPPIVDEPEQFGAIAAANALSDIYAMGGQPLIALSLVAFPPDEPPGLLRRVLEGGLAKLEEAGCLLGGGHSIRDAEFKFGYSVTGHAHPDRILTNAAARPGDLLVLTKPLGAGVITTALKRGLASEAHIAAAVASMSRLNRAAMEQALEAGCRAATDVTGFGLLGHAREMALASRAALRLRSAALPWLPGAFAYASDCQSQGLRNNREFLASGVAFAPGVSEPVRALMFDPQTSGGLLIAIAAERAAGIEGAVIGEVGEAFPAGETPGMWITVE